MTQVQGLYVGKPEFKGREPIKDNVKKIGRNAFKGCAALKTIAAPKRLQKSMRMTLGGSKIKVEYK